MIALQKEAFERGKKKAEAASGSVSSGGPHVAYMVGGHPFQDAAEPEEPEDAVAPWQMIVADRIQRLMERSGNAPREPADLSPEEEDAEPDLSPEEEGGTVVDHTPQ